MSRRLPSPIKIPFLNLKSSPMFEIAYAFEVWSVSGLALMNSSMDTLIAAFMSQASKQFLLFISFSITEHIQLGSIVINTWATIKSNYY